jgi:uncharacterized membrane protein (UPF0127 family)
MTQSRENAGFCRLGKQALTAGLALRVLIALLAAISLIQAGSCFSPARAGAEMLGLVSKLEALEIVTSSGAHKFSVEVMRSEKQRERGLMFRRTLPQDQGMLFIFPFEQPVAMWMKNTYLPLDLIFIAASGKVVGLAENAEPLSEKIIPSVRPVYAVLEVNAGTAARIGLRIGDTIRYSSLGK